MYTVYRCSYHALLLTVSDWLFLAKPPFDKPKSTLRCSKNMISYVIIYYLILLNISLLTVFQNVRSILVWSSFKILQKGTDVKVAFVDCSPHLCVGFLFLVLYSRPRPPPPPPASCRLTHTPTYPHTHTQLTHAQLTHIQLTHLPTHTHTTYSHTTYPHTTYPHTHTQLTHTHTHTTYPHTTYPHTTYSHRTYPHTTYSQTHNLPTYHFPTHNLLTHNLFTHHLLTHHLPTLGLGPSLWVAGVALMALGWLWWRAWVPFAAMCAAAVCVAGVALGDIHLPFAWQAWHFGTSIFVLLVQRGAYAGLGWLLVTHHL